MEFSQTLAVESFSCSWSTSVSSPLDGLDEPLRASLDSALEATSDKSENNILESELSPKEVENFNFDVPICNHPEPLVHADELFSDGLIKPVFINQSRVEASETVDSVSVPTFSISSRNVVPTVDIQYRVFKRWIRSSERILKKWFRYLRHLCHNIIGAGKSRRVNDIDRREWQVKKWRNLPQASPYMACSTNSCCDIESSIYEAVLHCKRSIDK